MVELLKSLDVCVVQVEKVFFDAMLAGYVSDKKADTYEMIGMSGYQFTKFIDDDFFVKDVWCKISGFTSIWYKDVLIWTMNYGGHYHKKYIPFLKSALQEAYAQRVFYGGRGSSLFLGKTEEMIEYLYVNKEMVNSNFKKFSGRELILDCGREVGCHNYFGGLVS